MSEEVKDERDPVELHCAYVWTCEECGRDSFVRAVIVEMSEEDARGMMEAHGGEPDDWKTGMLMTRPDEVTCDHCGLAYPTVDSRDGPG